MGVLLWRYHYILEGRKEIERGEEEDYKFEERQLLKWNIIVGSQLNRVKQKK